MQLHAIAAAVSWGLGDTHGGFPAAFAQFARAASPVAVDAMWQGAAVALGLLLCLRIAPRVSASHRFAAWATGFAVVLALPFLPFVAHLAPVAASAAALAATANPVRPWFQFDARWALAIAALWLAASAFRLAQIALHSLRLRKLWKTAAPIADADLAASLKAALPTRRRVDICTTQALDRPSVIGFFAPRILIPEWLYARLTPQELTQVVMHEAEHLRRHDDWTNLIQKLFLVLFPLNPALAWIERRLCREREMACDEGVVRLTQRPRAYAACLASLAERKLQRDLQRRAEALSLAAWRRRPELVHRVHGILGRKPALSPAAARVVLCVVGCGLVFASVELARCPQVVGFAARPQPQLLAQAAVGNADALHLYPVAQSPANPAVSAAGRPAFRVVPAVAILPSSGSRVARVAADAPRTFNHPAGRQEPASRPEPEFAMRDAGNAAPHITLLKAETPHAAGANAQPATPGDASDVSQYPQYFVLTAFTEVQTAPQTPRVIADYDTGASAGQNRTAQTNAANDPAQSSPASDTQIPQAQIPQTQIIVTRLILRIEPAGPAVSKPASGTAGNPAGSNRKPQTGFKPLQQRAVIPFGNGWLVFQL